MDFQNKNKNLMIHLIIQSLLFSNCLQITKEDILNIISFVGGLLLLIILERCELLILSSCIASSLVITFLITISLNDCIVGVIASVIIYHPKITIFHNRDNKIYFASMDYHNKNDQENKRYGTPLLTYHLFHACELDNNRYHKIYNIFS